ncbi:hypothetical protein CRG98_031384 [Punica granatum]|uniref:Uncharacterized protein n=1 Tax=Punica granatum TaxID=22663 RepID=A0A2I0IW52_PUNGR|nr:hypothetical protein CRG98_031384 [Punica granatum]
MQPPYSTLLKRVQSRWTRQTTDRAPRALSGKSRYAHAWLTGASRSLASWPPRTEPICTVKAKFFTGCSGDPKLKICVRTRMWTLVGACIALFWIARLGSVHLPGDA